MEAAGAIAGVLALVDAGVDTTDQLTGAGRVFTKKLELLLADHLLLTASAVFRRGVGIGRVNGERRHEQAAGEEEQGCAHPGIYLLVLQITLGVCCGQRGCKHSHILIILYLLYCKLIYY